MFPVMWPRLPAAVGISGLAALGLAYCLTYEPAPSIRVEWRDDVTSERQAELERKYQLSNGRSPKDRSIAYDLLDTRQSNVKALVSDPDVVGTNDIDRRRYVIPFDAAYGDRWMWVAHRVPGLRDARIRWALVAVLALMTIVGLKAMPRRAAQSGDA